MNINIIYDLKIGLKIKNYTIITEEK